MTQDHFQYFIGLMSGTSLDGVDGVLLQWQDGALSGVSVEHNVSPSLLSDTRQLKVMQHAFQPFDAEFRAELLSLNTSGNNQSRPAIASRSESVGGASGIRRCTSACTESVMSV